MKKIITLFSIACFALTALAGNEVLNLKVSGMHCGGCETKFKTAAAQIKGIGEVKAVSAEQGTATITYDPAVISAEKAVQSLAESTGYTVTATTEMGTVQAGGTPSSCCSKGQSKSDCKKSSKSCKSDAKNPKTEE